MKKIILPFLMVMLIACKSKNKSNVKDSVVNNLSSKNESEALKKKFKPFIQGVWVKSDYVNDLTKTRSPYESKDKLRGIASMSIDLSSNKSDSTDIGFSLNNHEGSEFILYFKIGQMATSLKATLPDYSNKSNFYELGYSVKNKDTILILYHYGKNLKPIDSVKFTKVLNSLQSDDIGLGIEYITDKKLITGKYITNDSIGNSLKIEFTNDGKVSGFLDFKTYYLNADFEAGPENNLDEIDFDVNTKMQKSFTFHFSVDTLNLYDTYENADSTKLILGKLKYKLVRLK